MPDYYRFEGCTVIVWPERRYLETRFGDGAVLPAAPEDDYGYRATAASLGYRGEDPCWRCCFEHEILHHLYARWRGLKWSPTLWSCAHPGDPLCAPINERHWEEDAVMRVQRCLNDPEYTPASEAEARQLDEARRLLRGDT